MMCQHCGDAPCEIGVPGLRDLPQSRGPERAGLQPLRRHALLLEQLPVQGARVQLVRLLAPEKATFAFPEPLNWQLNPDVTVRSKGVMEKCTICIQRILEGKGNAKDEKRAVRDGEIQTACAQSCPTQAIVFGDLMDPESAVVEAARERARATGCSNELNTKPGVTYLKKVDARRSHERGCA